MRYFCMLCEPDFYDSHSCFNHVLECGGVVKNTKTLRDEFAIAWLQGYMANSSTEDAEHKDVAEWAYLMADAMMIEREQKK